MPTQSKMNAHNDKNNTFCLLVEYHRLLSMTVSVFGESVKYLSALTLHVNYRLDGKS